MRWKGIDSMRWRRRLYAVKRHRPFVVERHRLYAGEASTLCGKEASTLRGGGVDSMRWRRRLCAVKRHRLYAGEASTLCGGGVDSTRGRGIDRLRWIGMNYRSMRGIYYWGCRFDSFHPLLLSVPYYIHTSLTLFPCSPCHLSLLACRSLCIIVRALDICVRPPFSAFCTHITLRRRSTRPRRFKRWVWSPCGTHAALTRPTGCQRGLPCCTHFFFAMQPWPFGTERSDTPYLSPHLAVLDR
jgi:hypothetical protein